MNQETIKEMPVNPMKRDEYEPEQFNAIGKRGIRRIDGYKKAGGKAIYTSDIILPGMLHARWFTSPYPNAKILSMDTSKAEAFPGVQGRPPL